MRDRASPHNGAAQAPVTRETSNFTQPTAQSIIVVNADGPGKRVALMENGTLSELHVERDRPATTPSAHRWVHPPASSPRFRGKQCSDVDLFATPYASFESLDRGRL